MRPLALLLFTPFLFAAPVPKRLAKPAVEVTLAAETTSALEITVHNHGKEPLELPYRGTPLRLFVVELRGETGWRCEIRDGGAETEVAPRGTWTIPAGEFKTLTVHTCHWLPDVGKPGEVTFTARLESAGKVVESAPLMVK